MLKGAHGEERDSLPLLYLILSIVLNVYNIRNQYSSSISFSFQLNFMSNNNFEWLSFQLWMIFLLWYDVHGIRTVVINGKDMGRYQNTHTKISKIGTFGFKNLRVWVMPNIKPNISKLLAS